MDGTIKTGEKMRLQRSLFVLILFLACVFVAPTVKAGSSKFVIEKYHVRINVTKENTYQIQEKITVNFLEPQHGIYRDIPKVNKIFRADGRKGKTVAKLEYVSCGGTQFERTDNGNYYHMKIGNPDKTITGNRDYHISYDYVLGNDILRGNDEFYFNVIGNQWETTIQNVTFEIHMPEEFSEKNLGMVYGETGANNVKGLSYRIEGKSIYGALDSNITLQEKEGMTVRLLLPEGYFLIKDETRWPAYTALGIGVFAVLLAFGLWWKVGRDEPVEEHMECYPPDGMNSLEVAFAYKGKVESSDVVSLVVYLAQKGYIEIREGESEEDFVLKRIKQYDGTNQYERIFMEGLFEKGKTVRRTDLVNSFYKTVREIENKVNGLGNKKRMFFENSLNKGLKLWGLAFAMFMFALVPPVWHYEESIFVGIGTAFCASFIAIIGTSILYESRTMKDRIITGVAFLIFTVGDYVFFLDKALIYAGTEYLILYVIIYVLCGLITFFEVYMPKRTKYGTKILGRVLGFKRYLEETEKEELEERIVENPQYYYDILPYTYVLDISKKWMKKFEVIALKEPKWYRGKNHSNFHVSDFNNSINSTMNSATSSMTSAPGSGGGGFSGGGSGGGGGGSW